MKKGKGVKQFHTASTQTGSGDYHGTGIRNPVGRMRDSYAINAVSDKKLGKKPKALA